MFGSAAACWSAKRGGDAAWNAAALATGTDRPESENPSIAAGIAPPGVALTSLEFCVMKSTAYKGDAGSIVSPFQLSASFLVRLPAESISHRKRSRLKVTSGCAPL